MSTASDRERAATSRISPGIVLRDVLFGEYVALRDKPANDHLRMTYHDGTLEIMSPHSAHERPSRRVGVLISVVCEELDIEFEGLRSTTFRRGEETLKKGHGKEPDECFYFANAPRIQGKGEIDLNLDPPPDLWVEIDHRSSSRGKLPTYAVLKVPELWRYRPRSDRLWFGRLADDGTSYQEIDRSLSLPMLSPALVREGLALGRNVLEMTWTKALRGWVRETFLPPPGPMA